MRAALARLILATVLGLGLAACNDGYGYDRVAVGYGYPGSYGWYGDYYYPGAGYYVYDRYRRPFRWNADQQRYWEGHRGAHGNRAVRDNWRDFRRDVRDERRDYRGDIRGDRQAFRNGAITRDQFRQARHDARQEYRGDVRQDFRDLRQQNRAQGFRTPRPNRAFDPRPGGGRNRGGQP